MRVIQLPFPIAAIAIYFILNPLYTFLFFSALSLISLTLSIIISPNQFRWSNERIIYNLEYLSALSLILSSFGILIDNTFTSIIYPILGISILAARLRRDGRFRYIEDFVIILLSIIAFWIIYYQFLDLKYIAFLLGINTSLLIGFLSYLLMKEVGEEEEIGIEVKGKLKILVDALPTIREIIYNTTLYIGIAYVIIWLLKDNLPWLQGVNMTYFSFVMLILVILSVILYFRKPSSREV